MQRLHSRRRIRSGSSVALDSLPSRKGIQTPHVNRRSRAKLHMASTSRHRPPRGHRLALTPSALWNSLPLSIKIITFLAGFLALYYFLFAKHQKYDRNFRKMKEIHKDLEEILRKANESGFMDQNLAEAVLPAIFREADDSSSTSSSPPTEPSVNKVENKTMEAEKSLNSTSPPQDNSSNEEKKRKARKKKRKKRKKVPASAAKQIEKNSQKMKSDNEEDPRNVSSVIATNPLPAKKKSTSPSSIAKDSSPDTAGAPNSTTPEEGSVINVQTQSIKVDATRKPTSASGQSPVSSQLDSLDSSQLPNDSLPILNWNLDAIMNESTPEQIFGLGNRLDHVVMYKPLCLDTKSGEGIIFEGETVCGGFNRTAGWLNHYCSVMKSAVQKEFLFKVQSERKRKAWLEQHSESIEWVTGVTLLQVLERNCGNIAHFSGRALLLQHMIENVGSYAAPPSDIANILIVPTFHVMKRFLYPERYVHWHKSLIRSLVAPAKLEMGDLGRFLYRSKKRKPNEPLVQLLHNLSVANSQFAAKKYVCFKRAMIPGYLKGRFFVNDIEYPSNKPSFEFFAADAPVIPRDSLRMRERVSALVDQTPEFRTMQKEIILIDRKGKRRIFDETRKPDIMKAFETVAKKHGYKFKPITFENDSFAEQYKAVSSASIAVGIHGANLVNTMFMPPLSVLIEVFPYGFVHDMYKNGGNAGLKYFSYQMSTGKKFDGPNVYRSPEQCVRLNQKCKVHYRDAILQVTDKDIANMANILENAVAWCDKLPAPSKYSSEPARQRRLLLRRLLDRVVTR